MTRLISLMGGLALAAAATAAAAQSAPPWRPGQTPATTGDLHRYEMDRLRWQSDQRAYEADRYRAETQARVRDVETARQPPLATPPVRYGSVPPEVAAERRSADVAATTQIDDWLDRRSPN